jgi:hypothetical protein
VNNPKRGQVLKIDKANESALLIALTEGIQGAYVRSYSWVHFPNDWEATARSTFDEDFSKRLYNNLDDGGLESLVRSEVLKTIYENGLKLPEKPKDGTNAIKKLTEYDEFSDALAFARKIVEIIRECPYQYEVCVEAFGAERIKFPSSFSLKISDRLSLVSRDMIPVGFQTKDSNAEIDTLKRTYNARGDRFEALEDDAIYFLYRTSGLITDRARPKCFSDMYDDIRAFYGAALAYDILGYFSFFKEDRPVPVFGNRRAGEDRYLEIVELAETDIHDASQSSFVGKLGEELNDAENLERIFAPIVKLFHSNEFARLRTASIWLLRSFLSDRGMDRILDACIAIEVLLGDRDASDRVGLSKLMANRCAYALGKSAKERRDTYDFFLEFYRLRSEIVHSGRLKISDQEEQSVSKGVALASRILRHEVGMH